MQSAWQMISIRRFYFHSCFSEKHRYGVICQFFPSSHSLWQHHLNSPIYDLLRALITQSRFMCFWCAFVVLGVASPPNNLRNFRPPPSGLLRLLLPECLMKVFAQKLFPINILHITFLGFCFDEMDFVTQFRFHFPLFLLFWFSGFGWDAILRFLFIGNLHLTRNLTKITRRE